MEKELQKLIGSQLVGETCSGILLKKDGKVFELEIDTDSGDCCGYADFKKVLLIDEDNIKRNPVITKVEIIDGESDYDEESCLITLYGENLAMATVEATAGSGSGWHYGACVTVKCPTLGIAGCIASW